MSIWVALLTILVLSLIAFAISLIPIGWSYDWRVAVVDIVLTVALFWGFLYFGNDSAAGAGWTVAVGVSAGEILSALFIKDTTWKKALYSIATVIITVLALVFVVV